MNGMYVQHLSTENLLFSNRYGYDRNSTDETEEKIQIIQMKLYNYTTDVAMNTQTLVLLQLSVLQQLHPPLLTVDEQQ